MRASIILFSLLALVFSCKDVKTCEDSSVPFDGQWDWISARGIGFDGVYFQIDSASEGYKWKFVFFDSDCTTGKLQTYRNEKAGSFYIYNFTSSPEALEQKIELDKLNNSIPEKFYWQIEQIDGRIYLYLRDPEYHSLDERCCKENLELTFIRNSSYTE